MLRSLISRQLGLAATRSAAAALGAGGPAVGSSWWAAAAAAGALHTASPLLASLQVKIPALGESISDGTVSAVLKQPGERVEEDEPILQIETDKVTVDVRAPRGGVIEAILVKQDDNVEVGHVVASIAEGATAAAETTAAAPQPATEAAAPAQQQAAAPPPPQPAQQAAPAASAPPAAAAAEPAGRQPMIQFPPRRTPTGEQISAMPRAEAERALAALLGGAGGAPSAPAAAPIPPEYKNMIAVPIVGGSSPILRGPPVPPSRPGPPRRVITDFEMEAIMLGGAEP